MRRCACSSSSRRRSSIASSPSTTAIDACAIRSRIDASCCSITRPAAVTVVDEIFCRGSHTLEMFWHFAESCEVTLDGSRATARRGGCPARNAAAAGLALRAGARSRRCAARLGVAALRPALADVDAARPGHDFRQRPPGHAARTDQSPPDAGATDPDRRTGGLGACERRRASARDQLRRRRCRDRLDALQDDAVAILQHELARQLRRCSRPGPACR